MSILYPWLLLVAAAGAAVTIAAFRTLGEHRQLPVPTLFLVRQVARTLTARKKLRVTPRMIFELLLLAILAAAFCGLQFGAPEQRTAVILDTSLSMERTIAGQRSSVLALAKEQIQQEQCLSCEHVTLVVGGHAGEAPNQEILQEARGSKFAVEVEQSIERLSATYPRFEVYTDKAAPADLSPRVRWHQVPGVSWRPGNNVAVELLDPATIMLHAFMAPGTTSIEGFVEGAGFSQPVVLTKSRTTLPLPGSAKGKITFRASANADELSSDNSIELAADRAVTVRLHGEARTLSFEAFKSFATKTEGEGSVNLFYRESDVQTLGRITAPSLLVLPKVLPGKPSVSIRSSASVASWEQAHPLLTYLNAAQLRSLQGVSFERFGATLHPVVTDVAGGALLLAGSINKQPVVVVGFELFPLNPRKNAATTIFFLNVIKYLTTQPLAGGEFSAQESDTTKVVQGAAVVLSAAQEQIDSEKHELLPWLVALVLGVIGVDLLVGGLFGARRVPKEEG